MRCHIGNAIKQHRAVPYYTFTASVWYIAAARCSSQVRRQFEILSMVVKRRSQTADADSDYEPERAELVRPLHSSPCMLCGCPRSQQVLSLELSMSSHLSLQEERRRPRRRTRNRSPAELVEGAKPDVSKTDATAAAQPKPSSGSVDDSEPAAPKPVLQKVASAVTLGQQNLRTPLLPRPAGLPPRPKLRQVRA